jgi:hypothetical protein
MLQIRQSAFETNSSSVHTFFVKKDFKPKRFRQRKTIKVRLGRYGRHEQKYTNDSFLNYVFSCLASDGTDIYDMRDYVNRINAILEPYNVCVEVEGYPHVEVANIFKRDVLSEMLEDPKLFASAVLCDDSYFCTGLVESDEEEKMKKEEFELFHAF